MCLAPIGGSAWCCCNPAGNPTTAGARRFTHRLQRGDRPATQLDDGRYNIVLRGLDRFRVLEEDRTGEYRRAAIVELIDPPPQDADRPAMTELRARLDAWISRSGQAVQAMSGSQTILKAMPDVDLVHTLAQHLDLEPIEKQAILERDSLRDRAEFLLDLLEMKRLEATMSIAPNVSH